MKFGVDARLLSDWRGGQSVFLENILREMERLDQENFYYLYSNRDFRLCFSNPRWQKRVASSLGRVPGTVWLQTDARRMVIKDGIDVFWGPGQSLPFGLPPTVGKVLTVHDFVWRLYPRTMPLYTYAIHRLFHERWIKEADRLIAISASTARDLEGLLGVARSRIDVVYHGVRPEYRPSDPKAAAQYVAQKYQVSEKYICTVGTIQPRKNLLTLLRAMKILFEREHLQHQLVVVGAKGWKESAIWTAVKKLGLTDEAVRFLGFVPDEDMPSLYSGAAAFVFPSVYEGFGLPLVEAMACGVPMVASEAPPAPELVEDAALLVPPLEPEAFAGAIARITREPGLRATLVARGLDRARAFRWDTAAQGTLRVLTESARAKHNGK
ncbi:MAG TPA: glycosyltransferase family 1 protein [Terriglobia bacterium]|nr:glycosyltransferase family 1 protein [Terriglobia bacterium]